MKLSQRINLLVRCLEDGMEIKLKTGHTLVIPEDHTEPGFAATSFDSFTKETSNIVFQIGSDVAWMFLINHAKEMTEDEAFIIAANTALTQHNRAKRERA